MGEATWQDKCPICEGKGKIQTESKRLKKIDPPTPCEACNGTGLILVTKKLRKRDK